MTVYYVSSITGADNNVGTSASAPLASLQAAANVVKPGDTVQVMNGTYTAPQGGAVVDITTSGTASAPITFEAAPGQTPIIDTTGGWEGIQIQASYIVVSGFTVVGNAANYTVAQATALYSTGDALLNTVGINVNTPGNGVVPNHITIENNTIYDQPGAGIGTNNSDYISILNNVVYDNANWSPYGASGISIGASVNSDTQAGVHDVISGNLVFDNAELVPEYRAGAITDGEGIILDTNPSSGSYVGQFLVQNNTVYGNGGPGILSFLTNNVSITGNTAYGNVTNATLKAAGETDIFVNQSSNVSVTNNSTTAPTSTQPSAPVISNDTVNSYLTGSSTTSITLNGTATPYSLVTLYNNNAKVGTATAAANGAWTFTTGALANGSESFTATATDSAGNVSSLSSPFASTLNVPSNLVANGNFATGDFTNWSLAGNWTWQYGQEITIDPASNGNAQGAAANAVRMNSVGPSSSDGTLSQTISTVAGQTYTISFWLKSVGTGNNDFKATWNGQTLLALTNTEFGYTQYTYTVTATSNSTTLGFSGASLNGESAWYLDNVSVFAGAAAPAAPSITAVSESPATGHLGTGNVVTVTLSTSKAVTIAGGTPTLTLNDGGTATYTGGSGTNALTFSYTVAAGQNSASLAATAINLNGATVKDSTGNAANLSLSGLTQSGPLIDTTPGSVSSVVASGTGITAGTGDLGVGKVVTLTLNLNEAVTVAGGTPTLTLNDGGTATYAGGSGTSSLTFSYTVAAGQNTADLAVTAVNLNSATVKDGAGNVASLTGGVTNASGTLQIDTTVPTVASVAASGTGVSSGNGTVGVGSVVTLTVNLNEAVTVSGGTPTLTLNDGGTATYAGGSGTNALTFSYTVGVGQSTSDLAVTAVNLNSASVKDGAGNVANLAGLATNPSGILQVGSTTLPASTVTSVVASGAGITAGNGDLGAGKSVTLAVNMTGAVSVSGGTPTLTLNDGGTATYAGGAGTGVLTFNYTVAAGQNASDLSVTAVNLNGATIKDGTGTAASLAGAVTNPSGTLKIDTLAPVVSSIAESPTVGALNAGKVVTYTIGLSDVVTVNTSSGSPTLTFNDGGTATYVGGSGTNALTFSYTVLAGQNTPDLMISSFNLNGATIADGAGNSANMSLTGLAQGSPSIDTKAPTVSSVVASGTGIISGNGNVPAGSTVALTVNLSEAVTIAGGTPTLTLNDGGIATLTGGNGTNALTFSYSVGAGQRTSDLSITAINLNGATLKDGAGNAADLTGAVTNPSGTLQVGGTTNVIESAGATALTQIGNNFFLNPVSGGTGPELQLGGVPVTASRIAGWTFIGAEKTSGGYEVALKATGSNQYTVEDTDSNGNIIGNVLNSVSGSNSALVALEASFDQDLNGDGTIGPPTIVIEASGSTALDQVGNNYFLNSVSGGTGPELKFGGSPVTVDQIAGWSFIGAEKTSTGYDVALKATGSNQYMVEATDSNGNITSNVLNAVSGSSAALQAMEATFHQDLNGDGIILLSGSGSSIGTNSLVIGNGASVEITGAYSGSVSFAGTTGTLQIDHAASFAGKVAGQLAIGDKIDLADVSAGSKATIAYSGNKSPGTLTVSDGTDTAHIALLGNYTLANFTASSDGHGGTSIVDPPASGTTSPTSTLDASISQRLALFSQHISSAFPSSGFGDSTPSLNSSEVVSHLSQLARSIVSQHQQA